MSESNRSRGNRSAAVLILILAIALVPRLYRFADRSITHPEFYVPGLELPDHVTQPRERLTEQAVVMESLDNDVHPPGYFVIILWWSRVAGVELGALRLPSLIFGLLGLVAIFLYGKQVTSSGGALLAAGMLALHGSHIHWSQHARGWSLTALLVLVSSWLLLRLARRPSRGEAVCYAVISALGIWTEYYFWPVFATHVGWVLLRDGGSGRLRQLLGAQVLAMILSTPMLLYLLAHMTKPNHLVGEILPHILAMMQFGGALNAFELTSNFPAVALPISIAVAVLGGTYLVIGAVGRHDEFGETNEDLHRTLPLYWFVIGAALATWFVVGVFRADYGHRKIFALTVSAPWLLVGGWGLVRGQWGRFEGVLVWMANAPLLRWFRSDPAVTLMLVPFAGLCTVALISPILASYALVSLTPLFLVVMARGVMATHKRVLSWMVLLPVFTFSTYQFATMPNAPEGYKEITREVTNRILPGEIVLTDNQWWTAPVNFYLRPDRYTVAPLPGSRFATLAVGDLPLSVWVIGFQEDSLIDARMAELATRLPGFELREIYRARNAAAARFVKAPD